MSSSADLLAPVSGATRFPAAETREPPPRSERLRSAEQESRARLNASIVEASLTVSIQAGNEPQTLLFRSAIDRLNEILEPEFGPASLQGLNPEEHTAEATAGRIVSLSTGFFDAFKQQHPGESEDAVLEKFMTTIRAGFEQGFADAQGILKGLGVLKGEIAAGIDRTHELVMRGYADFEASMRTASSQIHNGFIA